MNPNDRLTIAPDAAELLQRHAVAVEQVAALLGRRLRGEPVRLIRVERAPVDDDEQPGLVFRVSMDCGIEEAQHLWELIEQDLSELHRSVPPEQRAALAAGVAVVVEWAG